MQKAEGACTKYPERYSLARPLLAAERTTKLVPNIGAVVSHENEMFLCSSRGAIYEVLECAAVDGWRNGLRFFSPEDTCRGGILFDDTSGLHLHRHLQDATKSFPEVNDPSFITADT